MSFPIILVKINTIGGMKDRFKYMGFSAFVIEASESISVIVSSIRI